MCKHAIPVEIVVEAENHAEGRQQVINLLFRAQADKRIFHYIVKNGEED